MQGEQPLGSSSDCSAVNPVNSVNEIFKELGRDLTRKNGLCSREQQIVYKVYRSNHLARMLSELLLVTSEDSTLHVVSVQLKALFIDQQRVSELYASTFCMNWIKSGKDCQVGSRVFEGFVCRKGVSAHILKHRLHLYTLVPPVAPGRLPKPKHFALYTLLLLLLHIHLTGSNDGDVSAQPGILTVNHSFVYKL